MTRAPGRLGAGWLRVVYLLPALLLATPLSVAAQEPDRREVQSEIETGIETVAREWFAGGRVDFTAQGDRVAFDRQGADGLYDVWVFDVEGDFDRCLTCEIFEFRKVHCLDPVWHPSGDYLVMAVQQNAKRLDTTTLDVFGPRRAPHSDLWLLRKDGKAFWQLTQTSAIGSAVLDPRFSYEGELLAWSERTTTRRGGPSGAWRSRTAELSFKRGVPRLRNSKAQSLSTKEALVRIGDFTPDDRALLVAANLSGQSERGLDIYRLSLTDDTRPERLTHTSGSLDGEPHAAPRSDHVAWISAAGVRGREVAGRIEPTELWLMRSDGSQKQRLTYFNDALADMYRGATAVGDVAWHPEGKRLVLQVLSGHHEAREHVVLLELATPLSP